MKVAIFKGKIVKIEGIAHYKPSEARIVEIMGKHIDYNLKHFIVQNDEVVDVREDYASP